MSGQSIIFDDKKIKKSNFYKNKKLFKMDDRDANKILFQTKNHMAQISQSNISLDISTMIGNKTMSFKVSDEKLLKKCTKI